jgi:hypothetical protein
MWERPLPSALFIIGEIIMNHQFYYLRITSPDTAVCQTAVGNVQLLTYQITNYQTMEKL